MVVRKKKKFRKFRGHRTYGTGSHKKARGGGNRGGRGQAGMHKHKWTYTVKFAPDHFGKHGFKRPIAAIKKVRAINLRELDRLAGQLLESGVAQKVEGKIKIDLLKLGYEKVLGGGGVTKPMIIEAKMFSKQAAEKLETAGGKAVVVEKK